MSTAINDQDGPTVIESAPPCPACEGEGVAREPCIDQRVRCAACGGEGYIGHEHDFSHPYRGHLMCADELCSEVRTTHGRELTEAQRDDIRRQILADIGLSEVGG